MSPVWLLLTLLPILGGAERFNCKGRILGGYYADAKSGCKAFHVCVRVAGGGIKDFRFFCPPGTLFHQEAQTCTDWGDDDALACPADIYDGLFDLYRIGSGYDTKKLSSSANREEEPVFGLQRAETGDRRLPQNNAAPNGPVSDLRAAHSSDFFSGQRDRGRDDSAPQSPPAPPAPPAYHAPSPQRQTFRRPTTQLTAPTTQRTPPTTQRTPPTTQRTIPTTQYTTPSPPPPPQPSNPLSYEVSKRKIIRKRPIYASTLSPTTFPPNTPPQQSYSEPQQFNRRAKLEQNNQNRQSFSNVPNVPPQYKQYKDEYVEVSRVTPKQNRFYPNNVPSTSFPSSTSTPRYNKKDGLVELYNYDAQSTPGLSQQNDNRPFKVKNSFNVQDVPRVTQRAKNHNQNTVRDNYPTNSDYAVTTRGVPNTTPVYKNYNSLPYEPEKKNFVPYSKQNHFNAQTTTIAPITTIYTTTRSEPPPNLNTIAYNTNIAFQTHSTNYDDSNEDDGQYHPPHGEDDGQYKPELYDHELLSGAHSLNIAASGNRLPEERKQYAKTKPPQKPAPQTAAPRPFRPASTPTQPPTRAPEPTTTNVPQTVSTQRTFDYYQTYTTTSRPGDYLGLAAGNNEAQARPTTTVAPRLPETRPTRPTSRAPPATSPPAPAPRPTTRAPNFSNTPNKKEDNSYDYAYYDSDNGFSEYDHIEEFGKTKTRA